MCDGDNDFPGLWAMGIGGGSAGRLHLKQHLCNLWFIDHLALGERVAAVFNCQAFNLFISNWMGAWRLQTAATDAMG